MNLVIREAVEAGQVILTKTTNMGTLLLLLLLQLSQIKSSQIKSNQIWAACSCCCHKSKISISVRHEAMKDIVHFRVMV